MRQCKLQAPEGIGRMFFWWLSPSVDHEESFHQKTKCSYHPGNPQGFSISTSPSLLSVDAIQTGEGFTSGHRLHPITKRSQGKNSRQKPEVRRKQRAGLLNGMRLLRDFLNLLSHATKHHLCRGSPVHGRSGPPR